jgi:fructose-bisphosphate aldolase/2-amino-3,7-dideoxy-D-threo-hept-6-ulosonate synthase
MSEYGRKIRLDRVLDRNDRKTVIIPLDHGITLGPIRGLIDMKEVVDQIAEGGANAILANKGIVRIGYRGSGKDIGLIMHLSASTVLGPDPDEKVPVTSVIEAIKRGADAVSIHINLGSDTEPDQLGFLGKIVETCNDWGMPVLAMIYPRGRKIKDEFDVEVVKHAARIGAELGVDIVKTNYTGSEETFKEVVRGCSVPVVMAGGPKADSDEEFCKMVHDAMHAGAAGVAAGRNVFQHQSPTKMVRALCRIVHDGQDAKTALA